MIWVMIMIHIASTTKYRSRRPSVNNIRIICVNHSAMVSDKDIHNILEAAYEKPTTFNNYIHRLERLRDTTVGVPSYTRLLSAPDASYEKIRAAYPNITTRKNMLTVLLTLFKNVEQLRTSLPDQHKRWKTFHDNMDSFQEAKYKKHMPDVGQLAKYTPFEDIEQKYRELSNGDPHQTLQDSLQFILLSIVVSTPPKRSDYGSMQVYYENDPNQSDTNYIVINGVRPSYMVFTKYKTSKEYKRVEQDLPAQTTRDIKASLRRHPRDYLFVNRFRNPFASNDGYSKFVVNTFSKLFGRNTGVTMLRHIFITEKLSFDEMDDDELEGVAQQMLHSTKLQKKYNWSKKAICSSLKKICPECK